MTGTVKVANDLVCPDSDGLIVGADNTVIDLNGHRISCQGSGFEGSCQGVATTGGVSEINPAFSEDNGVEINRRQNVHVFTSLPGGTLEGFDNGVRIGNAKNVKVEFLTITGPPGTILANPRPASHGVLVNGASCDGPIHLGTGERSGNDVSNHNQGIAINGDCVDIVHNRLHDNDGGLTVRGGVPTGAVPSNGLLISDGARNVARGNEIFQNGDEDASDDAGVRIRRQSSTDNLITNNVVSENLGDGILLTEGAMDNFIVNNTMFGNGGPLSGTVFYDAAGRGAPGEPPDTEETLLNEWNQNNRCLTQNEEVPPGTCEPDDLPPGEG
ncbi:MAG TPA: right-handed parallel beta-helix repeat-containing protein [Solirubrobacteraceae bacterium]|nr:right-handed parallel beta-helix repeat-containing protein [Solirubrobacteraceae bacterium]